MSNRALVWFSPRLSKPDVRWAKPEGSEKEVLMSSLKSAVAVLEREANTVALDTGKQTGPVLVPKVGKRVDNYVTSRVEAALDAEFANGSMPA